MLGSLIGGVGSLIGGLIGGNSSEKGKSKSRTKTNSTSRTQNKLRLGALVRTAERNGFNPLTLLRSGGLAAFTDSTTKGSSTSFSKTKSKGSSSSSAPLGAGIAGAANIFGGAVDSGPSQESASARDAWSGLRVPDAGVNPAAEMNLINAQLRGVDYGTLGTQPRHAVQSSVSKTPELAFENYTGLSLTPDVEKGTVTNPYPTHSNAAIDKRWIDADAWEKRYSDPGGWAAGVLNAGADGYFNLKRAADAHSASVGWDKPASESLFSVVNRGVPALNTPVSNLWDPPSIAVTQPVVMQHAWPTLGYKPAYDPNNSGGAW